MSTPPQAAALKIKRIVWTGAIASITVVGTIYGAGLKTVGDRRQQIHKIREATLAERIAHLEGQRGVLVGKKIGLQRKIDEVEMRRGGATREESTRGMERRRGEGGGGVSMEGRGPRVVVEDNLRVVGMGTGVDVEEGEKGRERKRTRGWW
ncbi:hypothetical protein DSL72_007486 [Monilinia vaccinii-corymbosi]|uniref:Uncharacterized protein n=1 Tax=Monilinia vaccinii-corymbosi TaxID=61207 RepID=A0A8A3PH65_9HELO|nr:hypothetical protein DSL72_007486 [Monilinia vaccinii-corymbosi]